jgi:aspartate aminotransferase
MTDPEISDYFRKRKPSVIRAAQIEFSRRKDGTEAINLAIGNVSLPMHPAMTDRMKNLDAKGSPFKDGVVRYTESSGFEETKTAFLNIIASSGFETKGLHAAITDGASHAMELVIVGLAGKYNGKEKPILLIDAAYPNYRSLAERTGRKTISITRNLLDSGKFTLPDIAKIEEVIKKGNPAAMVVIPYDNPTGHFYDQKTLAELARLCVKYNLWMVSDEAYRELHYLPSKASSIWGITDKDVPGIEGRRISLETASKVWNACGLRIGAIVSDNEEFLRKCVAENTANLCAPAIDQYIFGSLAHLSHARLQEWYSRQRGYYNSMLAELTAELKKLLPGIIVSSPDASIYSVIDVKNIAKPGFDAMDFVMWCAKSGKAKLDGKDTTLLVSPMEGFYNTPEGQINPGKTQMRLAYVEPPGIMKKVPGLFADLFRQYESSL